MSKLPSTITFQDVKCEILKHEKLPVIILQGTTAKGDGFQRLMSVADFEKLSPDPKNKIWELQYNGKFVKKATRPILEAELKKLRKLSQYQNGTLKIV